MRKLLLALMPLVLAPSAAFAQKEIPKAQGFDQCPAGYVNTLGTTCVSPVYYQVAPTNGDACQAGWMNIGAGYCKKKRVLWECSDPRAVASATMTPQIAPVLDEVGVHPVAFRTPRKILDR